MALPCTLHEEEPALILYALCMHWHADRFATRTGYRKKTEGLVYIAMVVEVVFLFRMSLTCLADAFRRLY